MVGCHLWSWQMCNRIIIKFALILIVALVPPAWGISQPPQALHLTNPSFEDYPRRSHVPAGWVNCGAMTQSPPDVHPSMAFEVDKPAHHGATYVGLVARDNGIWESIGQRLPAPLQAGQCYRWQLSAAQSDKYVSMSVAVARIINFTDSLVLKIWAGNQPCEKAELLAQSEFITSNEWNPVHLHFTPQHTWSYVILEATLPEANTIMIHGHVLLDGLGPIVPVDCGTGEDLSPALNLPDEDSLSPADLITLLQGIQFKPFPFTLETAYFKLQNESEMYVNPSLYRLVRWLKANPQVHLELAVKSSEKEFGELRVWFLQQWFLQWKVPQKSIDIHRYRSTDKKKDWLVRGGQEGVWGRLKNVEK